MPKFIFVAIGFLASSLTFADTSQFQGPFDVSWAQFRKECEGPNYPEMIEIACSETRTFWAADGNAGIFPVSDHTIVLNNSRSVTFSVTSDRSNVLPKTLPLAVVPQIGVEDPRGCPKYREVQSTLATSRAVSCREIIHFDFSLNDFCAYALDWIAKREPNAVHSASTGNEFYTCKWW